MKAKLRSDIYNWLIKERMNWRNEFQRLTRIIEVEDGLYCEHLPIVGNEDNIVINSGGKKVCKKCCDHHVFKPFINKKFEKVCLLCCQHDNDDKDKMGNRFCAECFSETPQNFCGANSKIIIREQKLRKRQEKLKKQQEKRQEKLKKRQEKLKKQQDKRNQRKSLQS